MTSIRYLLLGSAAGLFAVAGAQAADLPAKAKPAEYVKVCSLYGAGYFYIPGTDTCLKIGGFIRSEYVVNAGGGDTQFWQQPNSANNRYTNSTQSRSRFVTSFDARTQTDYGVLRSYIRAGYQYDTGAAKNGVIYFQRAFIQLGGFTFGKTISFFEAYSGFHSSYSVLVGTSTTDNAVNAMAYTAQFGNGFSGTIAVEDPTYSRAPGILSTSTGLPTSLGTGTAMQGYGGTQVPDIIGNVRVDQAWGSAQVMAALHQVRATYYNPTKESSGAPDDKWGFAVGVGVQVNLPWAAGDKFTFQATYAEGANHYVGITQSNSIGSYSGGSAFEGLTYDAIYGAAGTELETTKTWGGTVGIEHYWIPTVRTSLFGAYASIDFNEKATTQICGLAAYQNQVGCNPDWSMWQVGTRTIWNPVKNLDVGLELLYTKFESEHAAGVTRTNSVASNGKPATAYQMEDIDAVSGMIRVQRNFWP